MGGTETGGAITSESTNTLKPYQVKQVRKYERAIAKIKDIEIEEIIYAS